MKSLILLAPLSLAPLTPPVVTPAALGRSPTFDSAAAMPLPVSVLPSVRTVQPALASERVLPKLESGDLVFLDLGRAPFLDAIAEPTMEQYGVDGPRLHHSGLVEVVDGQAYVWESWPRKGVTRVPLRFFLARVQGGEDEAGGYYLGRMRPERRSAALAALARVKGWEGRPFEESMALGGPGFYCAQLISAAFEGSGFFTPKPMVFGREGSPARELWKKYFAQHGLPVPDGELGVSPLGLYLEGRRELFDAVSPR
ncbi:MAG: hypothetical protein WC728_08685 [Elusimicrobiota bacterium]